MRHLIAILILILATSAIAADYSKINISTEADINKVYFYNDQMGWAVTSDGEILNTFDGGKTWRMSKVCNRNIRDIDFLNRSGFIVGDRGLLMKTTNGGASWEDQSLNMKYNLVGVGIVDDSTIVTCGTDQNSMSKSKGEIFESRNYGKTWKKHDWRLGHGYTDMAVNPPKKVYLLASKKVYHSISKGVRYFPGEYEGDKLGFGFDFIDDWGFMVGHKGFFAHSITHGRKWDEIKLDTTDELYAVELFDKYSGVAVGEDGLVMYFYEDGARQVFENCGYKIDLNTVAVTGDKIFFGGDDGLLLVKERFPRSKKQ